MRLAWLGTIGLLGASLLMLSGCSATEGAATALDLTATPSPDAVAVRSAAARPTTVRPAQAVAQPELTPTSPPADPRYPPYAPPADGTHLVISAIGVDAPILPVGVTADGEVESPSNGTSVGWYNLSPAPGPRGNSILVGHVDYHAAAAVFWRLREVRTGDKIEVRQQDGTSARYEIEWVQSFPIGAAPLDVIFASTNEGKLTLITCEGQFDQATHNYQHRLVVRAQYLGP